MPETCDDISLDSEEWWYGCCKQNVLYWCNEEASPEWTANSMDCDHKNLHCDYDENYQGLWCIE